MPVFKGSIRVAGSNEPGLEASLAVDDGRLLVRSQKHEIGNWALEDLLVEQRGDAFHIQVEGEELVVAVGDAAGFSDGLGMNDRRLNKVRAKKLKAEEKARRKKRSDAEEAAVTLPPVVATPAPPPQPEPPPFTPPPFTPPPVAQPEPPPITPPPVAPPPEVRTPGPPPVPKEFLAATPPPPKPPSLWSLLPLRWKLTGFGVVGLIVFGVFYPGILALLLMVTGMVTLFLAIAAKGDSQSAVRMPAFFTTTPAIVAGVVMVVLGLILIAIA